ncbi:transcription antitermination factor NusB [Robiginitalea sp. SC105]|uniref:transcription antitermination factor NusB n=1 Tax=Robiginitalea sp. SC105 TaxID=2762332 RepID=UPI00163A4173|nr:transcription antitermination factor NusB [Robiginitalea sp. SC105]MBC2839920.1 transcription antitermination factor NusB [Robiginitalea sp. SC105]
MLTRRQIRVKVMQCIYAITLSRDGSLEKQEKFLKLSIGQTFTLYILMLGLLREIYLMAASHHEKGQTKYLKHDPSGLPGPEALAANSVLRYLGEHSGLKAAIEKRKLRQWYLNEEYVKIVFRQIAESPEYADYASGSTDWETDRDFVLAVFREIIAPNEKIYEFLEDEGITWVDDIPLVNTFIVKRLAKLKEGTPDAYLLPPLLKNSEDMEFAMELLRKTLLRNEDLEQEIEGKTPNWDKERIADIDGILLKMGIAELLYFPSIPERVTINEYLEIAKEYSTPKSSIFINGILDKLIRDYREAGKLKKTGRGLL